LGMVGMFGGVTLVVMFLLIKLYEKLFKWKRGFI
jgi:hypothetical protein